MSLGVVSLAGIALFVWPFFGVGQLDGLGGVLISVAAVAALALVEFGTRRLDAGRLALLAVIAAINAALRLALVTGIAGFSPMFFLILTAGYAFGPSYGVLVGAFSILVSGVATGGVGPWLPYEMFAAGWVGVAAGVAGVVAGRMSRGRGTRGEERAVATRLPRRSGSTERGTWLPRRVDLVALLVVAALTGFAYGALTDVWDWATYWRGAEGLGWLPGASPATNAAQFARFYVVTSLGWDAVRAAGNVLAILALGMPVLMAMRRLQARLGFERVEVADGPALAAPARD